MSRRRTHYDTDPARVRHQALNIASSLIGSDAAVLEDIMALDGLTDDEIALIEALRKQAESVHANLCRSLNAHRRDGK